jgi:CBS domain-containing protein
MSRFLKTIIHSNQTIEDAILSLNASTMKMVLVVNNKNGFLGTVTDGDIRRGLLKKLNLKSNILLATNLRPITMTLNKNKKYIFEFMIKNKINRLPILNKKKNPIDLICIEDFLQKDQIKNKFIIMAGGRGLRMGSLTKKIPKPLLLVNKKPIIKHIIGKAIDQGFKDFYISVNYLHKKIIKNCSVQRFRFEHSVLFEPKIHNRKFRVRGGRARRAKCHGNGGDAERWRIANVELQGNVGGD